MQHIRQIVCGDPGRLEKAFYFYRTNLYHMKKNLLLTILVVLSFNSFAQILGNLDSVNPNTAQQGQTLTTTITEAAGSYLVGSPPCDNYGIFMIQGIDTIFSNLYNWQWMDVVDVEWTIPPAAPLGFYDVYVASSHYDWWQGTCTNIGYWVLPSGFEVTLANGIKTNSNESMKPVVSPNPFRETAKISFDNHAGKIYTLTVMDCFGREVYREMVKSDQTIINGENLDAGIYFYKLEGLDNNKSYAGEFVVVD